MIVLLIQRMIAVFGKLQNQTLELTEGLNIIQAPNETGKSTWCAFLAAMLYGVNSRERDRAGFIADKNRYAPWSGIAMSGRLDCRTAAGELSLLRTTRRQTSPMGDFQAVYAGTKDPVPNLTGQNCGEQLLGVSREVFERSAFIRQSGLTISQDPGLERRIAALITSGEEDTSYIEAEDLLKKQLNRRRHHKTGLLPTLEAEIQEIDQRLKEMETLAQQLAEEQAEIAALQQQESALSAEAALHDQWDGYQRQRICQEAGAASERARQKADVLQQRLESDRIPENETIGRLRGAIVNLETVRKAVDSARTERDAAMKAVLRAESAVNESPFSGQTPESAQKEAAAPPTPSNWKKWPGLLVITAGTLASFVPFYAVGVRLTGSPWQKPAALGVLLAGLCITYFFAGQLRRRAIQSAQAISLQKRFGTADPKAICAMANAYSESCAARDAAQAAANAKAATAEALYTSLSSNEQGILLEIRRFAPAAFDISAADQLLRSCALRRREAAEAEAAAREAQARYEVLRQQIPGEPASAPPSSPPDRSREATAAQLDETRFALSASRSAADRLAGQLHALGDPVVLRSQVSRLNEQKDALEAEYTSIRLALDALSSANTILQNRFSPALGRRAAEIFSQLTDKRYSGVVLDRAFRLAAEPAGGSIYRDAALLSAGTSDQLYLAVRLAICELVLPAEKRVPIILDDALANFDEDRCAAALQWLKAAARGRQILLFTCHTREADFFREDMEVSIQRLTNAG
ncbi:AAA domain-containing protein [Oscillibacter sp. PC13]|uniref:ATP-binding protein n=1 Tax=Oscillibacter sp. PC13 TaxID=1855299 RepID=UPI0008EA42BB|nr:AAA family ATPase [Oscillibacter sp. PC13]SFQ18076.1 AAA domain-containing protein [Oscillibacter sp. PC13]